MKLINVLCHTLFILCTFDIDKLSKQDIEKIRNQYTNHLSNLIKKPVDDLIQEGYLMQDVTLDVRNIEKSKTVAVIDLGGSFFKVGLVKIKIENNNLEYETIKIEKVLYPVACKTPEFWFTWVSKQIVDTVYKWDDPIDTCSLIFSYPIKYENNGGAYQTAFPKFWCFENSRTKFMEIKECLNNSIQEYIRKNNEKFPADLVERFKIRTVLNDSVATYFASKFVDVEHEIQTSENSKIQKDLNVGMVLGTGTNAAFLFVKDDIKYIFNTEWASFVLTNINLLEEEKLQINQLPKSHNHIDILCAVQYKMDLVNRLIIERSLTVPFINHDDLLKWSRNPKTNDVRKTLFLDLCERSREILAALMTSIINITKCDNLLLIFNGGAYKNPNEIKAFKSLVQKNLAEVNLKNVKISSFFREETAFMGSAYYALWDHYN